MHCKLVLERCSFAQWILPSAENSDRRMDANNKYQLLVVLVQKGDDQPVDFALSNKFQVRSGGVTVVQDR